MYAIVANVVLKQKLLDNLTVYCTQMQTSWISSTETLWRNSYLCDMKRQGKITEKLDSFQMFGCVRPRVGLEREAIC